MCSVQAEKALPTWLCILGHCVVVHLCASVKRGMDYGIRSFSCLFRQGLKYTKAFLKDVYFKPVASHFQRKRLHPPVGSFVYFLTIHRIIEAFLICLLFFSSVFSKKFQLWIAELCIWGRGGSRLMGGNEVVKKPLHLFKNKWRKWKKRDICSTITWEISFSFSLFHHTSPYSFPCLLHVHWRLGLHLSLLLPWEGQAGVKTISISQQLRLCFQHI